MDNLSEKELKELKGLLKIIIQQNQVIMEQGKYIAQLVFAIKSLVAQGDDYEDIIRRYAMFDMADELIKQVNDIVLHKEGSMDNLSEMELLKIIIQQNQVIMKQGNYIAQLAFAIKSLGAQGYDNSSYEDIIRRNAMFDMANALIEQVNNDVLHEGEFQQQPKTRL